MAECPASSSWHGQLLDGLVELDLDEQRILELASVWSGAAQDCHRPLLEPWLQRVMTSGLELQRVTYLMLGRLASRIGTRGARLALEAEALAAGRKAEQRGFAQLALHAYSDASAQIDLYAIALERGVIIGMYAERARADLIGGESRDAFSLRLFPIAARRLGDVEGSAAFRSIVREATVMTAGRGLASSTREAMLEVLAEVVRETADPAATAPLIEAALLLRRTLQP
ncbi:MAG: hypothetical protein R3E98_04280 [Gemmatimonadota bacterium]